jgi:Flp pilus assembly protein TadD
MAFAVRAVELQPDSAAYRNTLGVARYRCGDRRAAITELTKAEELEPLRWFGHNAFFIAMAHWQLGERAVARDWHAKAVAWLEQHADRDTRYDAELGRFRAEAEEVLELGQPDE